MKLENLCKKRKVPKMQRFFTKTPILVPSFSSNISYFEQKTKLQELYDGLKESTPYTSLISAYDLHTEKLSYDSIKYSDLTFIDSGNYEYMNKENNESEWHFEHYKTVLKKLQPTSTICIISFDEYRRYKDQIRNAEVLFEQYPDALHDFLLKPEQDPKDINEYIWDFGEIKQNIDNINNFDIIGVTDKDLGFNLLERCQNLISLRELLGTEKPIHLFGCDDPQTVLLYNIIGADIFDGTAWTRFYFWRGHAVYLKQYSLITGSWTDRIGFNNITAISKNLERMRRFQSALHQFINTLNFDLLNFSKRIIINLKKILYELGVDY